nr:hypothetical protein [endosymbiont 'TC1' of Trimyema compressum]
MHYLFYGFWLGVFGGVLGIVLGYFIIPPVLIPILSSVFSLQSWSHSITSGSFIAVLVIVLTCCLAILFSVGKKIRRMPAQILKGDLLKKSKHSIFEKLKPLWKNYLLKIKVLLGMLAEIKSGQLWALLVS